MECNDWLLFKDVVDSPPLRFYNRFLFCDDKIEGIFVRFEKIVNSRRTWKSVLRVWPTSKRDQESFLVILYHSADAPADSLAEFRGL